MPSTITDRLNGLTTSVAVKAPVRVATTGAITLEGLQVVDGVSVVAGDRVLVKDQTNAVANGIYIASQRPWRRSADFDGTFDAVGGTMLMVTEGSDNANSYWRVAGEGVVTIGVDEIVFEATSGNLTLQIDLASTASDKGASLIGLQAGGTVQDAADNVEPTVWRRRPIAQAALLYPEYSADLATVGGDYLYPQGFDFDEDGNIYINTVRSPSGGSSNIVTMYDADFNYLKRFFRPSDQRGESVAVTGSSSAGTLKLYFVENDNLVEYAPGSAPADGATLSAATTKITGGCASVFTHDDGEWLIEQLTADLGATKSRTAYTRYDSNFNEIGRLFVPKNIVGWQTSSDANYPDVPKLQSIAMRDGKVYLGIGGSFIPATAPGGVATRSADNGIIEVSPEGRVLQYGICDAESLLTRVASLGYSIDRIENEGCAVGPDGALYTLLVTQRPGSTDASTTGLLLFKEMDMLAPSWADIASRYRPADLSRYEGKIWPRSADGKMRNPVSGAEITTMAQLLDLIVEMQLQRISYYTAAHPITAVSGFPAETDSMRVDIYNLVNSTLHAQTTRTQSPRIQSWWRLTKSSDWEAADTSLACAVMFLTDGVPEPVAIVGQASIFVHSTDGDLKVKFGDGTVKTIVVDS